MSQNRRNGSTAAWRKLRAAVLLRDGHTCQIRTPGICTTVATHCAHVLPKSRGGQDVLTNLRASCAPCNLDEGADLGNPAPTPGTHW